MEEIRSTNDPGQLAWILTELGKRLPELRDNSLYWRSVPHFLSSGAYKFLVAGPSTTPTAFGFVTFFSAPLLEKAVVLAVEAFWFKHDDVDGQLAVWRCFASLARQMGFHGVCVASHSVNTPASLEELLKRGELDGDPVLPDCIGLQASIEGIYSAFSDKSLTGKLFLAPCVRIYPQELLGSFAGSPSSAHAVFYRGEGNLPRWGCEKLQDLIALFMKQGFQTRGPGKFTGTVQQQLLQQGYVNQPTVSLSASPAVGLMYATHSGRQDGVVFTIDAARLRKYGDVFDSYATMARHTEPMLKESDLKTLNLVVKALRLLKAGRFLEQCNKEAMLNAYKRGGMNREPEAIDLVSYISEEDRKQLSLAGIREGDLRQLVHAIESFWTMAVTAPGSAITLTVTPEGPVEEEPLRLGYYIAFRQVQSQLQAALDGQKEDYRNPGWDLTPFGYIAKTSRDREFFSSGTIPGDCIVEATPVSKADFKEPC